MDYIKDLTSKDAKAYEYAASYIIDTSNVELFSELVSKDDFLFDFVKNNVAQRLSKACNKNNYKNILKFLDIYSPYYDEFISSTLAQYANSELTTEMLNHLENGTESAKTYAASYFSYIKSDEALTALRENAYSENSNLASNCARALAKLEDRDSYNNAIEKLQSKDSFEQYAAVKFLVNYQDKSALKNIFETMKDSPMADTIASEIPYLVPLTSLLNTELNDDAILAFCYILSTLAEITPISMVIDFDFYEMINTMLKSSPSGPIAVALNMAKEKFNLFIENEEYLFDEDKNTKNEVKDISILLNSIDINKYISALYEELYEESNFINFTMDLIRDEQSIAELLSGKNQTVIIKAMSILKSINKLSDDYKKQALENITDENLRAVAIAL